MRQNSLIKDTPIYLVKDCQFGVSPLNYSDSDLNQSEKFFFFTWPDRVLLWAHLWAQAKPGLTLNATCIWYASFSR